ncbi:MAG: hypothetical protein ACK4L4_09995 [Gemmobacter sp.]
MPKDPVSKVELTPDQARFIATFLKVMPKAKSERQSAFSQNERVKNDFLRFERLRAEAQALLGQVDAAITAGNIRHDLHVSAGGKVDDAFVQAQATAQSAWTSHRNAVDKAVADAGRAPKDAPVFQESGDELLRQLQLLTQLRAGLTKPTVSAAPGLDRLLVLRARIGELRTFQDVAVFTDAMARSTLPNPNAEKTRADLLASHDKLCAEADKAFDKKIRGTQGKPPSDITAACDWAEGRLADLLAKRAPVIKKLGACLNGPASDMMKSLARKGDAVAQREVFREGKIKDARKQALAALSSMRKRIKELESQLSDQSLGFDKRRQLQGELNTLQDQRALLSERAVQLRLYRDSAGDRVEKINGQADILKTSRDFMDDPLKSLQAAALAKGMAWPLPLRAPEARAELIGVTDDSGVFRDGRVQAMRKKFANASQRLSVDTRMFPDEPALTDITKDQLDILNRMLDKAKEMAVSGKDALAELLLNEADALYNRFIASNKFPLPELSERPPAPAARVDTALKGVTLALDRLWGIGGDANGALRKRLKDITDGLARQKAPLSFTDAETLLAELRADILEAQSDFDRQGVKPSPEDQAAREKAGEMRDALNAEMLKLYKTEKLKETEINGVPRDSLLVVRLTGGGVEYHKILSKHDDTENRRDNKHIPREVMDQLFEQASMLELLGDGDTPGCGDAIKAAVEQAGKLLANAQTGGKDYDHVAKQIKEVAKLEREFSKVWIPKGLVEIKIEFKRFQETYLTGMTAAEARKIIDRILDDFTNLGLAAKALELRYKEVAKTLDTLETEIKGGKGAPKDNPAATLKKLMKGGSDGILNTVNRDGRKPDELQEWARLAQNIRSYMDKLGEVDKAAKGFEGTLGKQVMTARQTLETRTDTGITAAGKAAENIRSELDKAKNGAATDPSMGIEYLRQIEAFIKQALQGAASLEQARAEVKKLKAAVEKRQGEVSKLLSKEKDRLASYNEYRNVYESLKEQAQSAATSFEKSDDTDAAISQYRMLSENFDELHKELSGLTAVTTQGGSRLDMGKWQEALLANIAKVGNAAKSAAELLRKRAVDDQAQARDQQLQKAVDDAAKALEAAADARFVNLVTLKPAVLQAVKDAQEESDPDKRSKALAIAREKAMAELRRIRTACDGDPALKLYRNNPMDKGLAWPQFLATLHSFDVKIMTELNPK